MNRNSEAFKTLESFRGGSIFNWHIFNISCWNEDFHGQNLKSPCCMYREHKVHPSCDMIFFPKSTVKLLVGTHVEEFPSKLYLFGPDGSIFWEEVPRLQNINDQYTTLSPLIELDLKLTFSDLLARIEPMTDSHGDRIIVRAIFNPVVKSVAPDMPTELAAFDMKTKLEVCEKPMVRGWFSMRDEESYKSFDIDSQMLLEVSFLDGRTTLHLSSLREASFWVKTTVGVHQEAVSRNSPYIEQKSTIFLTTEERSFFCWTIRPENLFFSVKFGELEERIIKLLHPAYFDVSAVF